MPFIISHMNFRGYVLKLATQERGILGNSQGHGGHPCSWIVFNPIKQSSEDRCGVWEDSHSLTAIGSITATVSFTLVPVE
jgi:hypothetical protein